MPSSLSPDEARAYMERYRLVNEAERAELRRMSVDEKFRRLASLMVSARAMGWTQALREGEQAVWKRWQRLREILGP